MKKKYDVVRDKHVYIIRTINVRSIQVASKLLDVKLVRKRLYCLNLRYKERVKVELDMMLDTWIIETVEELKWTSPMVM